MTDALDAGPEGPDHDPGVDPSTLRLAARVQRDSDHPSWNDLLSKVDERVRITFRTAKVPPPYTLDDLVAVTSQRVFRKLAQIELRDRDSFWAWVHRLAEHVLVDLSRWQSRQKRGGQKGDRALGGSGFEWRALADDRTSRASLHARVHETHEALLECLSGMREVTADVLRLRLLEHLSYEEIAEHVQRKKVVTVRSIFLRGREKLAECMRAKGFDDLLEE
ncbi:MAG: sigma-70 family RNA polymerase sigma factor [Planctomycetota bacterium]